jgi:hypothetical protein
MTGVGFGEGMGCDVPDTKKWWGETSGLNGLVHVRCTIEAEGTTNSQKSSLHSD